MSKEDKIDTQLQCLEAMLSMRRRLKAAEVVIDTARVFHDAVAHHSDKTYLMAYHALGIALDDLESED